VGSTARQAPHQSAVNSSSTAFSAADRQQTSAQAEKVTIASLLGSMRPSWKPAVHGILPYVCRRFVKHHEFASGRERVQQCDGVLKKLQVHFRETPALQQRTIRSCIPYAGR
jgi:hypothetical protein